MPTLEELRALSPDGRARVFRRRRVAVGAAAVALVAGGVLAVRSLDAPTPRADVESTTTLVRRPTGPCGAMPASTRDQVAELVMVGIDPADPAATVAVLDAEPHLGGLFVGGDTTAPFGDTAFRAATARAGAFVAVDDEGGRVQRLDGLAGDLPSARRQGAELSTGRITELAAARATTMRGVGVNMDLAPVVDVSDQADGDVIGDRAYGADAATVVRNAGSFADGLRSGGVLPVLKHFPGHGHASGDSHDGLVLTPTLDDLRRVDLVPYQELLDRGPVAVMVGHLAVPGLTEADTPASLSRATYRFLREEMGFGGLAITDDLAGMGAVSDRYDAPAAAEAAVVAGADLALLSQATDPIPIIDRLDQAVRAGRIRQVRADAAWLNVVEVKLALGLTTCEQLVGRPAG